MTLTFLFLPPPQNKCSAHRFIHEGFALIFYSQDNINQGDSEDEAAAQHSSRMNPFKNRFLLTQ